jgi:hypothetical protein
VIQSKPVNQWQEQTRNLGPKQGIDAGRIQMAAEMPLRVLKTKFGEIPDVVEKSIQSIGNRNHGKDASGRMNGYFGPRFLEESSTYFILRPVLRG